ncbi:hypothetical protein KA005_15130 [bacterium]|nr:hypothetical protein [bacterium]
MRVCIEKLTGKLIESQSGGKINRLLKDHQVFIDVEDNARDIAIKENLSSEEVEAAIKFAGDAAFSVYEAECIVIEHNRLATLFENALNAGYEENEIETKWVTNEEYQIVLDSQPVPKPTEKGVNEVKIKTKIRKLAITELIKEEELPADYI